MLKKLHGLFSKQKPDQNGPTYIIAEINDRIMPIDRGEVYEDPLDEWLKQSGLGEVTGGGTYQLESGEVERCDIEIQLAPTKFSNETKTLIIQKLEELGAPKGSKLILENNPPVAFGRMEGLSLLLDGQTLPRKYTNKVI